MITYVLPKLEHTINLSKPFAKSMYNQIIPTSFLVAPHWFTPSDYSRSDDLRAIFYIAFLAPLNGGGNSP